VPCTTKVGFHDIYPRLLLRRQNQATSFSRRSLGFAALSTDWCLSNTAGDPQHSCRHFAAEKCHTSHSLVNDQSYQELQNSSTDTQVRQLGVHNDTESPSTQTPDLATPTWPERPYREPHRTQDGEQTPMRFSVQHYRARRVVVTRGFLRLRKVRFLTWHLHGIRHGYQGCGKITPQTDQKTSITAYIF
jgi:hypothetical protein